jgi:DNA-binding response OmpR family regulator
MLGRVPTAAPQPPAPLALVVDDVPHVRNLLATLAARRGFQVEEAADGEAAVRLARERAPALILLDLRLPRIDGLQALAQIREADPQVAVVIVAAIPDRADLQRALDLGAVDFVRKPFDTAEVEFVLDSVYRAVTEDADLRVALDFVRVRTTTLEFPGRPGLLAKVVAWLGRELRQGYPGAEVSLAEIKLALYETLANAVEHGNLGITYDMKTQAMEQPGGMEALIRERLQDPRLAARKVHLEVTYRPDRVEYVVRDEGEGFDPQALRAKPLGDTTALHGRGLALVRHYMSEVAWNERGNEIRMVHQLRSRAPRA